MIVRSPKGPERGKFHPASRQPIHVVYGGADRFTADTPRKLGDIALRSIDRYAPNFAEFASAMNIPGTAGLPQYPEAVERMKEQIERSESRIRSENFPAWLAWKVYEKTKEKLRTEPIEDFRIDFEDGYGFRPDEEEDTDAARSAAELGRSLLEERVTLFSGFRIKPLSPETYHRATRTLELFISTLLASSAGRLPQNFVVTLPKISDKKQVKDLAARLKRMEKDARLPEGAIGIEIMIETPEAVIDQSGRFVMRELVEAAKGRCRSAHFGAYDLTSTLGIVAEHQSLTHPSCIFARQIMLFSLAQTGVRLSDSVTIDLPVPVHGGNDPGPLEINEDKRAVHAGWKLHYANVTRSISEGFFQSWDLHPNQLPARFAAVYSFFLNSEEIQAARLRGFLEKASKAGLTGSTFDDAASARAVINFFRRGMDCGAFTAEEIKTLIGVEAEKLTSATLSELIEARL